MENINSVRRKYRNDTNGSPIEQILHTQIQDKINPFPRVRRPYIVTNIHKYSISKGTRCEKKT